MGNECGQRIELEYSWIQRYPRLNCYRGHGAVEIDYWDINRGKSSYACAEACSRDWNCEGFVYMGSQRKCWRRRDIDLRRCERGRRGSESGEFMTCVSR